jgi:hypothetical protein
MRRSSANQLTLTDWEELAPRQASKKQASSRRIETSTSATAPSFPDFERQAGYAETARIAGRINASSVSQDERAILLAERQALLDKLFNGTITAKEKNRLQYVRWSLDRIEDAEFGYALDALESAVATYERLHADIQEFEEQLVQQRKEHLRRQREDRLRKARR